MPHEIFDSQKQRIPILVWGTDIEEETIIQAVTLANLPIAYHHIALMPDAHVGFGMPIGGIVATQEHIIPNAVGVDIGCGMRFVPLKLREEQVRAKTKEIARHVAQTVPVGFNWFKQRQKEIADLEMRWKRSTILQQYITEPELQKAGKQIGTLGSGNHFVELQKDDQAQMYLMVHSGSRNLGKTSADKFNRLAKKFIKESRGEEFRDLAYLPGESPHGQAYIAVMDYCLDFAKSNRKLMLNNILGRLKTIFGKDVQAGNDHDVHHNYARQEEHYGAMVWVHRKGATSAQTGEVGIIPGSMGAPSYIVEGKGNPASFCSCSHGSGRVMSRKEAHRRFDEKDLVKSLGKYDVYLHHRKRHKVVDEGPYAYKNIEDVINHQQDLIDIKLKLYPVMNWKG